MAKKTTEPQIKFANHREHVLHLIKQGGATAESLVEATGCTKKSLGSIMSMLRIAGHFPSRNADGVYELITKEDHEAKLAARGKGGVAKELKIMTAEQIVERATKRESIAATKSTNAAKRAKDNPNPINDKKAEIAALELDLASMMLSAVNSGDYSYETGVQLGVPTPPAPETEAQGETPAEDFM